MIFWSCLILSFFLVAFGQPAWIPEAGLVAAAAGYALFWRAMIELRKRSSRCILAGVWFMAVHAVQLSWMTSTQYMGPLILVVYVWLLVALGAQFAFLSAYIEPKKNLSQLKCLALAGTFVLLEWIRLYIFTGFTWNPAGLALAGSRYAIQWAALFGVYGLTFWVLWTNLAALSFLRSFAWKRVALWAVLALIPYGFGVIHEAWIKRHFKSEKTIVAAAINTGLKVEEKNRDRSNPEAFVPPMIQWERVWTYLDKKRAVNLIILPEAAMPYGTDEPVCPLDIVLDKWTQHFGKPKTADLPPLEAPFAMVSSWKGEPRWMATNAWFAQALANQYKAHVIIGLDYIGSEKRTNSAFFFRPSQQFERYDKRILAPVGEYIPLSKVQWIADFLSREFGIADSFDPGIEAKVFESHVPIGVPICLEEMYSGLVRDLRVRGAELIVSLSNDVWFPESRLAKQHFDHGRIRAVENGVFLLRSSNMGWTGGVNCFGQPIKIRSPEQVGAVYLSIPLFSYPTLFSWWGDLGILAISAMAIVVFGAAGWIRKRCS